MRSPPWIPDVTEDKGSLENSADNSRKDRRKNIRQDLPIQSFVLYQFRFLVAADRYDAFRLFGGMWDKLRLLSIFLNLCVNERANL